MPLPQWVHEHAKRREQRIRGVVFFERSDSVSVSVMCLPELAGHSAGVCSIDRIDKAESWVTRLKVEGGHRGRGLGEELIYRALLLADGQGWERAVVEPGGYGTPLVPLRRWYRTQGFCEVDGSPSCFEVVF
jgi:GNAT superfamily N-acetyltransferase